MWTFVGSKTPIYSDLCLFESESQAGFSVESSI
jgi:hypothetical protein